MLEPAVYSDDNIHVVNDATPIAPMHLLVVSKFNVPSFSDFPDTGKFLISMKRLVEDIGETNLLFFEKGRESFCTSMQSSHHAHGHLFRESELDTKLFNAFSRTGASIRFKSLEDAMQALRTTKTKYLIYGHIKGECSALIEPNLSLSRPQFLRRTIISHGKQTRRA